MTLPRELQVLVDAGYTFTQEQINMFLLNPKTCSKCKIEKTIGDFYVHQKGNTNKDGLHSICKECCTKRVRINDPVKNRITALKRNFNLTPDEYLQLFISQNHACAICKRVIRGKKKNLAVDHDHVTGLVRGLLCTVCNRNLLGIFSESKLIAILESAIAYLKSPPAILVIGERFVPRTVNEDQRKTQ